MKCVQKGLKKCDYTIYMDMNITTLPKKGLKTRPYSMDMNKEDHIVTLPKKGLKTRPYNIGMEKMEKKDLEKLTKGQLIKLLLKQKKSKKVSNHEDLLDSDPFKDEVAQEPAKCIKPPPPPRAGKWESVKPKPVPRKNVNEDLILPPPEQFQDGYKPIPKPRTDRPLQIPKIKELNQLLRVMQNRMT